MILADMRFVTRCSAWVHTTIETITNTADQMPCIEPIRRCGRSVESILKFETFLSLKYFFTFPTGLVEMAQPLLTILAGD